MSHFSKVISFFFVEMNVVTIHSQIKVTHLITCLYCSVVVKDVKVDEDKKHMMTKENQEEKKKTGRRLFSWMRKRQRQPTKSKCVFLICLIEAF